MITFLVRFCIFFLIMLLYSCEISKTLSIKDNFSRIPTKDIEILINFFRILSEQGFVFTLFGEKPCTIADYIDPFEYRSLNTLIPLHSFRNIILEEGIETWTRYSELFPSSNFFLTKLVINEAIEYKQIFIINKRATFDLLRNHLKTFQERLEIDLSAEEILNKMISDKRILLECTSDAIILGILLGYGETNANLFENTRNLSISIGKHNDPPFNQVMDKLDPLGKLFVEGYTVQRKRSQIPFVILDSSFESLVSELNLIIENRETFELPGTDYFLEKYSSPVFVTVKNNPETKQLEKKYLKDLEKVLEAYSRKSFLEAILIQWTQSSKETTKKYKNQRKI